jgi:molybdenum cofactor guanylyltransferase
MLPASGLVLAGGRSARMGRDKALLELGGRTLIERAVAVLAPIAAEVRLATGRERRYEDLGRPIVLDRVADGGPLAGIEAGLAAAEPGYVVVLAVDMPRVTTELVEALLARARAEDLDACLLASDAGPEPLCAVLHTRLARPLAEALERGARRAASVLELSPRVAVVHERELDAGAAAATNVNTPGDLAREREGRASDASSGRCVAASGDARNRSVTGDDAREWREVCL